MTIEVLKPGLLTTLQDGGRPGYMHLGIGRAGAFDAPALRVANALAGNPRDACGLEITLLGPTLRFDAATLIAVTGAPIPLRIEGVEAPCWSPVPVPRGATIELGAARRGCRSYLAVHGGVAAATVLGSRSTDVNAGLGPLDARQLRTGDRLETGPAADEAAEHAHGWWLDSRPWFDELDRPLRLLPGHHLDQLSGQSRKNLFEKEFTVTKDSNRVGVRLSEPPLELSSPVEMTSEGCVPGLLQLPPSGHPIAFGPECPVSGGYPRLGQIAAVDLPCLAQRRPGDAVRFMPCTIAEATDALATRDRALQQLEAAVRRRLRTGVPA